MPQKTWVVGEEVLAADFNLYVQNQVIAQFPTVAARDAWTSPPDGTMCVTVDQNRVWQRISGAWRQVAGSMPRFRIVGGGAGQSITTGTVTLCTFAGGTEQFDTDNVHAGGTFTCPASHPGVWRFDYGVAIAANGTGIRQSWFVHAGSTRYSQNGANAVAADAAYLTGSTDILLTATQTVATAVWQNSGVALTANTIDITYFQGRYLGPA